MKTSNILLLLSLSLANTTLHYFAYTLYSAGNNIAAIIVFIFSIPVSFSAGWVIAQILNDKK